MLKKKTFTTLCIDCSLPNAPSKIQMLPNHPHLTTLFLHKLTIRLTHLVAAVLPRCCALTVLNVAWHTVNADSARALVTASLRCPNTLHLALTFCATPNHGENAIIPLLSRCTTLATLCVLKSYQSCADAEAMLLALPPRTPLKNLYLMGNHWQSAHFAQVALALPRCAALAVLNLAHNCLGVEEMRVLGAVLPTCPQLHTLNLMNNYLGSAGARLLAKVIPRCAKLRRVFYDDNGLSIDDENCLFESLSCRARLCTRALVLIVATKRCCTNTQHPPPEIWQKIMFEYCLP